ncbi:MAG: hypothetical protein LBI96_07295 [Odoribacteraceae bacterium]|nr:hypothetical protein [Odoribacteraceae bacterium]
MTNKQTAPGKNTPSPATGEPVDVYVAGHFADALGAYTGAVLWKNGVATPLAGGTVAYSVFVSGDDVYVAGAERVPGLPGVATLWKNGVATALTDGTRDAGACSVFVSGGDVHVAGTENNADGNPVATVWKNGTAIVLSAAKISFAYSVFVSGGDVYVAGSENRVATLWKNGVATPLAGGVMAHSVFVSGADAYVARIDKPGATTIPVLWKNGVATPLARDANHVTAGSVFVSGGDVYVTGTATILDNLLAENKYDSIATLWKNGVPTPLNDATNNMSAGQVRVSGGDVYVAGHEFLPDGYHPVAVLWKNGVPTVLGDRAFAASVFVKTSKQ